MTATEALRPAAPATTEPGGRSARHWTEPSTWFAAAAPALAFFAVFVVAPIVAVLALSTMDWNGIGAPRFTALENWTELATDPGMWHSVWLPLQVMILCWAMQSPVGIRLGAYVAGPQKHRAVLAACSSCRWCCRPPAWSSAAIPVLALYILGRRFMIAGQGTRPPTGPHVDAALTAS